MKKLTTDFWPKVDDKDVDTMPDPLTRLPFCRDCWNNNHKREGCNNIGCQCGCYRGRNKGLGRLHPPTADCKDQAELPDVGTISV